MDVLTKDQRRKNMQAIKSKGTKIEVILGKALWSAGYRYRKNNKTVFGTPDFTFKRQKIAIFCDSEFFHGYEWDVNKRRIKSNQDFWIKKIESNLERDIIVNKTLENEGWIVLRFWGNDIKKRLSMCMEIIIRSFCQRQNIADR